MRSGLILGGGVTGLAAGMASGFPVFEARKSPGGICSSYYVRAGADHSDRLDFAPDDGEVFRFEVGGGHWIFSGDPEVLSLIERLSPTRRYTRDAAVYLRNSGRYVDYPLQYNLRQLDPELRRQALEEISRANGPCGTQKEWLLKHFGATLCESFFFPFHDRYTAGLYDSIAPQDGYKSPVNLAAVAQGASGPVASAGYNPTFIYPIDGLDRLIGALADHCDLRRGFFASRIDPQCRSVTFSDGSVSEYETLICTLPLHKTLEMAGISVDAPADPYTSVLVLNVGAVKGPQCPSKHWIYVSDSVNGFHRVGFYSNVDQSFLPTSSRGTGEAVSLYVERAYSGGNRPGESEVRDYSESVVSELTDWGYIDRALVIDPTWIDVAYTWERPGSTWKTEALQALEAHNIIMVGRYARWIFQGIADSLKDGCRVGSRYRGVGTALSTESLPG